MGQINAVSRRKAAGQSKAGRGRKGRGRWEAAFRRVEAARWSTAGNQKAERAVKGSWRQAETGSLKNQTGEIGGEGQRIANDHGLGGVWEAKPGRAFEAAVLLRCIAGFSIALAANAQIPGIRADLGIAGQADATIREGQANGGGVAEGLVRGGKRAGQVRWLPVGLVRSEQIRSRLVSAFLSANPFGGLALVVVAIGRKAVAMWAERIAEGVVAALETGKGIIIRIMVADANGTQGMQIRVSKGQDIVKTFTGIAEEFADLEIGKAFAHVVQARDGEQVVTDIGGRTRASNWPKQG